PALRPRAARSPRRARPALPARLPAHPQVDARQPGAQVRALRERPPAQPHRRRDQHELLSHGRAHASHGHLLHPAELQGQRGLQARPPPVPRLPGREALPARVVHRRDALALGQAHAAALRPPDPGAEPDPDEQSLALQKLAFEVSARINRVTPITATSLVTLALLGVSSRALSVEETIASLRNLLDYVRRRDLPTAGALDLDTPAGVRRTLDALVENRVVTCFAEGPDAVYAISPEKHLIASYYRNTIIHFFVNGAIAEL